MSFVWVDPELMTGAAAVLARIGSSLAQANVAAAGSTTSVLAAGADEVSAAVAALFGAHAQQYQSASMQMAALHQRFVHALTAGANAYGLAEAANVSPLQAIEQNALSLINAPTQALLGRPLIGDGANGATGTGQAGGAGGLLWG
ncbi:PE family protein, partial [Mycobacterium basiliense]